MAVVEKAARITVDLGDRDLYRRLRIAAAEEDLTIREVVIEAVTYWIEHREEIEDELALQTAERLEAESTGERLTHDEVKRRLAEM